MLDTCNLPSVANVCMRVYRAVKYVMETIYIFLNKLSNKCCKKKYSVPITVFLYVLCVYMLVCETTVACTESCNCKNQ